jgi:hypothetical protein
MMNKNEVLQRAAASVAAVESHLTRLDELTAQANELTSAIEELNQSEVSLLASDESNEKKLKKLLEVRAKLSIQQANLGKNRNAIDAATEDVKSAATTANLWTGSLIDALVPARKARILEQLRTIFDEQAILALEGCLDAALIVKEVAAAERFYWSEVNGITDSRKIRATFDKLATYTEAESPDFEIIAGDNW